MAELRPREVAVTVAEQQRRRALLINNCLANHREYLVRGFPAVIEVLANDLDGALMVVGREQHQTLRRDAEFALAALPQSRRGDVQAIERIVDDRHAAAAVKQREASRDQRCVGAWGIGLVAAGAK